MSSTEEEQAPRIIGVVGVVVRGGRLLAIARAGATTAPGKICFPGGGIEPGESEEAALRREMREELGLEAEPLRRLWDCRTRWNVQLSWWQATIADDALPIANPDEVASFHWLTPAELERHPELLESNLDFLAAWRQKVFDLLGLEYPPDTSQFER